MAEQKLNLKVSATEKASGPLGKVKGSILGLNAATLGLTVGLGSLLLGTKKVIDAARVQEDAEKKLAATIKSTGMAAGLTFDELTRMASGLQKVTTFGDEAIIEAESLLLTFTKIGKDVFPEALETILDVSVGMGQDLKASAIQLGKALNDPILGLTALSRTGIQFNDQQKEIIKTMVETGDVAGAQAVILKELNTQFGGQAQAAAKGLGAMTQFSNVVGDLSEVVGSAIGQSSIFQNTIDFLKRSTEDLIDALGDAKEEIEGLTSSENELIRVEKQLAERGVEVTDSYRDQVEASKNAAEKERQLTIDRKMAEAAAKDEAIAIFDLVGAHAGEGDVLDETTIKLKARREELLETIETEKKATEQKEKSKEKAIEQLEMELQALEKSTEAAEKASNERIEFAQKVADHNAEIAGDTDEMLTDIAARRDEREAEADRKDAERKANQAQREKELASVRRQTIGEAGALLLSFGRLAVQNAQAQKGLAISEATVSGILAVQRSLAFPPGPPATIPMSILIGTKTIANVAAIAAQGFQTPMETTRTIPGPSTQAIPIMAHGREKIGRGDLGGGMTIFIQGDFFESEEANERLFDRTNNYMKNTGVNFG